MGGSRAHAFGHPKRKFKLRFIALVRSGLTKTVDADGDQFCVKIARDAPCRSNQSRSHLVGRKADHEPLRSLGRHAVGLKRLQTPHVLIDPLCGVAQRELPKPKEISLFEESVKGLLDFLRPIDLSFSKSPVKLLGRKVDQFDIVGAIKECVGNSLLDKDAGDLGHDVAEALHMLNIERRPNVDPGFQQFGDVLPALRVAAAGRVGVRELVHQDDFGTAQKGGVQVKLAQRCVLMRHEPHREAFQFLGKLLCFRPAMWFDVSGNDIKAPGVVFPCIREHGEGFADPGGHAEIDFEPALLHGRGGGVAHRGRGGLSAQEDAYSSTWRSRISRPSSRQNARLQAPLACSR